MPLLSIAIPAYDRPTELEFGLYRFITQIVGKYENDVEIVVTDDDTPGDRLSSVRRRVSRYGFIRFETNRPNIGLERNLINCARTCTGEFLWIFGDDDFLEAPDALDVIMRHLRGGKHDFFVLNRSRRSFALDRLLTPNWMKLDPAVERDFRGLREFCLSHGFISTIGFISVNIFRREPFVAVDAAPYYGTMYPQLGTMVEAFHDRPVLLIGQPLVCHRTQTQDEKRAALGSKKSEADFMADATRRNALYFSHRFIAMIDHLINIGAFEATDIIRIPENTVINGQLIDFLIDTIHLSREHDEVFPSMDWARTRHFFDRVGLDEARRARIKAALAGKNAEGVVYEPAKASRVQVPDAVTISVVTPSYNQGEFLTECLQSIANQTHAPIEHLVFDPGSTDNSREIAASFPHVTLIAEPDKGQSDAINKGFQRVGGDIIAWLNSDDVFADERVFERVLERFNQPDRPDIVYGKGIYINERGEVLRDVYLNKRPETLKHRFQQEDGILQPALFMRRSVVERVGLLNENNHYSMDYEYWIRCMKAGIRFAYIDQNLALARYHSSNKTYGERGKSYAEVCSLMIEQFGYVNHIWLRRYAEFLADGHDGVLATAHNSGSQDEEKREATYRQLLSDYNGTFDVHEKLRANAGQPGYGDTLREMQALGIGSNVPCKPVDPETKTLPSSVLYTVGPRRWAFDATWKKAEIEKSHAFLRERIAARKSDVCVIVGNGPSLNRTDLSLLEGHDVIVSNNSFLSAKLFRYASYFTVVNYLVAEQSAHHINRLSGVSKVLPYWLAYTLNPGPDTHFVDAVGFPEFSTDMFRNMSWRHTVTFFNMHLAYGLGYRKVVMIGFDHSYKQSAGVQEQQVVVSHDDDENHFHPAYFKGKRWQAADVDMMEEMYRLAKSAFEADGREIVNATVGGKLELFRREDLSTALGLGSSPQTKTLLR